MSSNKEAKKILTKAQLVERKRQAAAMTIEFANDEIENLLQKLSKVVESFAENMQKVCKTTTMTNEAKVQALNWEMNTVQRMDSIKEEIARHERTIVDALSILKLVAAFEAAE